MASRPPAPTIFTIGHSTHPLGEFVAMLAQVQVDLLVDVRSLPRSRAHPQFNTEVLPGSLAQAGIGYRHLAALGGLRSRRKEKGPSPNGLWRNASFRNYADYALSDAFRAGLQELLALAEGHRCAVMCAEAVWWRCHRRLIADYLIVQGIAVEHILGVGKIDRATRTPGAVVRGDGTLVYPATDADEPT